MCGLSKKPENMIVEKFIKLVGDQHIYPPVQNCGPFIHGSGWHGRKFYGKHYDTIKFTPYFVVAKGHESFAAIRDTIFMGTAKEIFSKYLQGDTTVVTQRLTEFNAASDTMDTLYTQWDSTAIQKLDWQQGYALINEVRNLMWDQNAAVFFALHMDKEFCWQELQAARFPMTHAELENIWEQGTLFAGASFDKAQFFDVATRRATGMGWSQIAKECRYVSANYLDVKSVEEVEKKLREHYGDLESIQIAQEKINHERAELEETKKKHDTWRATLTPHEQQVVDYFQTIIALRDRRKNFFCKGITIFWTVGEHLFDTVKIDRAFLPFVTMTELEKGREYLKSHSSEIAQRVNGFALMIDEYGNEESEYCDFELAKQQISSMFLKNHSSEAVTELKGQIGCKGLVTGTVRVILNATRADHFKQGDILVAGMTRPEYVPLMKLAAGIITDEGGITCHAAIVSRELKIPCIIGTKVASKVLKDGDMVEVDADKGIVRILLR